MSSCQPFIVRMLYVCCFCFFVSITSLVQLLLLFFFSDIDGTVVVVVDVFFSVLIHV